MFVGMLVRFAALLSLLSFALADTEIRNFRLPLSGPSNDVKPNVTLSASEHAQLNVTQDSPDVWVGLVGKPGMWTARLSWPASHPAKFDMTLHPTTSGAVLHITSAPLTPRLKHAVLESYGLIETYTGGEWDYSTPFDLAFEPLRFGAIPESTFRTLLPTIPVLLLLGAGLAKNFLNLLNFELERVSKEEEADRRAAEQKRR